MLMHGYCRGVHVPLTLIDLALQKNPFPSGMQHGCSWMKKSHPIFWTKTSVSVLSLNCKHVLWQMKSWAHLYTTELAAHAMKFTLSSTPNSIIGIMSSFKMSWHNSKNYEEYRKRNVEKVNLWQTYRIDYRLFWDYLLYPITYEEFIQGKVDYFLSPGTNPRKSHLSSPFKGSGSIFMIFKAITDTFYRSCG